MLLADAQALTDNAHDPAKIRRNVIEVALDYLAVGIDPVLTTICLQSALPALAELTMLYLNFVSVVRLERNPTIKDEIQARGFGREIPAGFLCYPAAQAADITVFKAQIVPVGAVRLLLPFEVPDWAQALPSRGRGQFNAVWSKPMPGYAYDAIDRWEQTPLADRPKVVPGSWGSRPVVLLEHGLPGGMGIPEKYEPEWGRAQRKLATLSSDSQIVVTSDNHHPIAEENPQSPPRNLLSNTSML